jgi:hypothetical protein
MESDLMAEDKSGGWFDNLDNRIQPFVLYGGFFIAFLFCTVLFASDFLTPNVKFSGQKLHTGVVGMVFFMGLIVLSSFGYTIMRIVEFKKEDSKPTAIGLILAHIIVFCISIVIFLRIFGLDLFYHW